MRFTIARTLVLAVLLWSIASPAPACRMRAPFVVADVAKADSVFVGKLIGYHRVSPGRPGSLDDYGLLRFRVGRVLRGTPGRVVEVYWWNSTFGVPKTLAPPSSLIVATISGRAAGLPLRGPSATVFPSRRPDLPQLLQAPCSSPFLLPYSPRAAADIRLALSGGPRRRWITGRITN